MKFRTIVTILMVLLLSALTITACSQPAPAPTPTPTPTPTPAPAPAPSPTPTPAPAPAATHAPYNVKIWGFATGNIYFDSFAIATIVNRYSSWLRAEAVASAGSGVHLSDMRDKPALRPYTFFQTPDATVYMAKNGLGAFTGKPYNRALFVHTYMDSAQGFATYNPNIKTWQDLKGKTVSIMPPFTSSGLGLQALVQKVWGFSDTRVVTNFMDAGARQLRDGVVDAAHFTINGFDNSDWMMGPDFEQMLAEKPGARWISMPAQDIVAAGPASNQMFHAVTIKGGSLPGVIEDTTILANAIGSWADPEMPDDVAYELVKTLWNHMDEQKERFTSTAINKKTIAYMPVTDAFFQPGALKFYNEVGAPRTSWVHQGF